MLMGRLTKDPETRYTQSQDPMAVSRYSLAVDRRFKKDGQQNVDFINCVAFGRNGEFSEKYLHKGTKLVVVGHIQTGSYTNKDGQKVYTTDVVVDEQYFAESKSANQQNAGTAQATPQASSDGFMQIPDGIDSELPFL